MLHPADTYRISIHEHTARIAAADRERLARGVASRRSRIGPSRRLRRRPRPGTEAEMG